MKNFLFAFFMLLGIAAQAQGTCGCIFSNPTVTANDKFQVTISMIAGNTPFNLGGTNFRFNYNSAAINNVTVLSDVFPSPDFGATNTTGTTATVGVINTAYNGTANGPQVGTPPVAVPYLPIGNITPVPLITLEFNIVNPNLTTNLVFRQASGSNPRTVILDDDKVTQITQVPSLFVDLTNVPLPIELLSLNAIENGKVNEIVWETTMEENVRVFVVEKSTNGTDWTKLGETLPNITKRYAMTDVNPAKTTYYRLRNLDNDGRTELSKIVVVNRKSKDDVATFTVSPNPTPNVVKVTFNQGVKGNVTSTLMNVSGQVVHTQLSALLSKDAEVTTFDVDMADLPAGTYFLKVSTDKEESVETVVKQ